MSCSACFRVILKSLRAAPGNKTSQMSAIMRNKRKVSASTLRLY